MGLFSAFCRSSGLPQYFSLLQWCLPAVFLHFSIAFVQVHEDENSEKNIRAQTLQEVSLSLFSLMALISFSFSLLKRKEEL